MPIEIRGIGQLDAVARSLADLERTMMPELTAAAAKGASGLESSAKASALQTLPKQGGLARVVADSVFTSRRSPARFSIQARSGRNIRAMNLGVVRHPVFGNRARWVSQRVRRGWWDRPAAEAKRATEDEVRRAMDRLAQRLGRVR